MASLLPTPEQAELANGAREFLSKEFALTRLRANAAGSDAARWQELADFGLLGLGLDEADGGSGQSIVEEVLVFREVGRVALTTSLLATVAAAKVAAARGDHGLARSLSNGAVRAALGVRSGVGSTGITSSLHVFDPAGCDLVVVAGQRELCVLRIEELESSPARSFDDASDLVLARLPHRLQDEPNSPAQLAAGLEVAVLCTAMLCGIAQRSQELAVEYAKLREQFGKPIGTFQAIKHRCADMAVRTELATAQLYRASVAVASGEPASTFHVLAAKALATTAALENSASAIQVHGGIGFTAECDVHWLLKRAHVLKLVGPQLHADVEAFASHTAAAPMAAAGSLR